MGRKDRKERAIKRDTYATKHSAEKRKQTLIAIGVLAIIAVIVGYAGYLFLTMTVEAPGGPENAVHWEVNTHMQDFSEIFGDEFDSQHQLIR
jgi:hypothetical protein